MKVEKFCFGNGVEVLTDNELKATRGGSPNFPECCSCSYTISFLDEDYTMSDSGTICGSYGGSCYDGLAKLASVQYGPKAYISESCCS